MTYFEVGGRAAFALRERARPQANALAQLADLGLVGDRGDLQLGFEYANMSAGVL